MPQAAARAVTGVQGCILYMYCRARQVWQGALLVLAQCLQDLLAGRSHIAMSMPQTGQIQTSAASGGSYANAFRAELRGDGRMAGGVRFDQTLRVADASQSAAAQKSDSAESDPENGFIGFLKSVLDVINPLQHLPVIGTMYRHLTGDEIGATARVAGGALYGGPIGAALGVVGAAMESTTGKDMGDTMLAMLQGDDVANPQATLPEHVPDGTSAPVMLAAADIVWHSPVTCPT